MLLVGVMIIGTKCVGDIDYESVFPHCSAITPVPGGIGPLTINMLMYNTIKAAYIYCNKVDLWKKLTNGTFIDIDNLFLYGKEF